MSNMLRPPSLGPIVGHTTDASVRVWIRAADAGEHRSIGVAGLCQGKRVRPSSVTYFRLRREYDRTGVSDFNNLKWGIHLTQVTTTYCGWPLAAPGKACR